jgi:hypothetical protein
MGIGAHRSCERVSILYLCMYFLYLFRQKHPIALESHHPTLLPNKSITFTSLVAKNLNLDAEEPEWRRVTLEDGVRIIEMKEVRGLLFLLCVGEILILGVRDTGCEWCPVLD